MMKKGVRPKSPVLVVGLPGIGSVGVLVAEQIRKQCKAAKIATVYSPHFPSSVIMTKSGRLRLASNRFYLVKQKAHDILLLTGDCQALSSEGQYEVNSKIVDFFAARLKGKFIYTLGGYLSHEAQFGKPRVFANATSKGVIKEFKSPKILFGKSHGEIYGAAGMILTFAKLKKVDGICLLGESSFMDFDAAAAKAVMGILSERLNLKLKTDKIDELIKEAVTATTNLVPQFPAAEEDSRKLSYIR
jgi:hypothetical protein